MVNLAVSWIKFLWIGEVLAALNYTVGQHCQG